MVYAISPAEKQRLIFREEKNERRFKKCRRGIPARFASGLARTPRPLGFELSAFFPARSVSRRVLDRGAKRRACICQAPATVPFGVLDNVFLLSK